MAKEGVKKLYKLVPSPFLDRKSDEVYYAISKIHQNPMSMFKFDHEQVQDLMKDLKIRANEVSPEQVVSDLSQFYNPNHGEESKVEDPSGTKKRISILDFLTLIILLNSWSLGEKIDLLLILYDMQGTDQLNLSEILILLKSVLKVTQCFEDIPNENLEAFIENLCQDFIELTVDRVLKEK